MTTSNNPLEDEALILLAETCCTVVGPGGASERMVLLAIAYDAGVDRYDVMCDRCQVGPMTLRTFITNHYARTEQAEREAVRVSGELGNDWQACNPGLHAPGDVRLAYGHELPIHSAPPVDGRENPSGLG